MCRAKMSMTLWYVLLTFLLFHCLSWISPIMHNIFQHLCTSWYERCTPYFPPSRTRIRFSPLREKQSVVFLLHLVSIMKMENLFRVLLKTKTECSNKMIKQATVFIMTFCDWFVLLNFGHFFKGINWVGWYTHLLTYFVSSVTCTVV